MNNFYKGGRVDTYFKGLPNCTVQQKTTAIRLNLQMSFQALSLVGTFLSINSITLLAKLWKSKVILLLGIVLLNMYSLSTQTPRKDSGAEGLFYKLAKRIQVVIFLLLIIQPIATNAQFYIPDSSSLYVGDRVPDKFYTTKYKMFDLSTKGEIIKDLDEDREKLIVLDFWANWCKPCLYYLMKMDSISKDLDPSKVKIVPVTYQSSKELIKVADRFGWNYTSITEDTVLSKMFPHQSMPHMIWIYKGKVIAKPKSDYMSKENVDLILRDSIPEIVQSNAIKAIDVTRPLFIKDNGETKSLVENEGFKLVGFIDQYFTTPLKVYRDKDSVLLYAINNPLDQIIYQAFQYDVFQLFDNLTAFKWNVNQATLGKQSFNEPAMSYVGNYTEDMHAKDWMSQNYFSYALKIPVASSDSEARLVLQKKMRRVLLSHFGLRIKLIGGPRKRYAALRLTKPIEKVKVLLQKQLSLSQSPDTIQAQVPFFDQPHFRSFVSAPLKNMAYLKLDENTIVDETGLAHDFFASFAFPKTMRYATKLEMVQRELKRYGMKIVVVEKKVPMLYISEIKKSKSTY